MSRKTEALMGQGTWNKHVLMRTTSIDVLIGINQDIIEDFFLIQDFLLKIPLFLWKTIENKEQM